MHRAVGRADKVIHRGGVLRVDELRSAITQQGVRGRGATHWDRVVIDYGTACNVAAGKGGDESFKGRPAGGGGGRDCHGKDWVLAGTGRWIWRADSVKRYTRTR